MEVSPNDRIDTAADNNRTPFYYPPFKTNPSKNMQWKTTNVDGPDSKTPSIIFMIDIVK